MVCSHVPHVTVFVMPLFFSDCKTRQCSSSASMSKPSSSSSLSSKENGGTSGHSSSPFSLSGEAAHSKSTAIFRLDGPWIKMKRRLCWLIVVTCCNFLNSKSPWFHISCCFFAISSDRNIFFKEKKEFYSICLAWYKTQLNVAFKSYKVISSKNCQSVMYKKYLSADEPIAK